MIVMALVQDIRLCWQPRDPVHHPLMMIHVEETGKVVRMIQLLRVGVGQMNAVFQRCENVGGMG